MKKHNIFFEFKFCLTLRRMGSQHPVFFTDNRSGLIHDRNRSAKMVEQWALPSPGSLLCFGKHLGLRLLPREHWVFSICGEGACPAVAAL